MSGDETLPADPVDNIACLLVPVLGATLLIPSVTVAEMAPMQPVQSVPNSPQWMLGKYEWRNAYVPVVVFEAINGGKLTPLNPQGRMAVLNNTGVDSRLPFIAIPTQGIPRMVRIGESDIVENTLGMKSPFVDMAVKVGMEELVIPNVTALEQAYVDTGLLD
ncbi:chemotaxis protein CheW [Teredinibacter turnerae]|uniref:chemotaxis protein CheW n=1 Tax=Teredinibacter turnerae TaxID=2426 RepID=UPI00037E7402|nr:chemotaxis protein CheW [Teredinibacter turnerae]